MSQPPRSRLQRYAIAAAAVGAAAGLRGLLDPWLAGRVPFPTFLVAVLVAGWIGGFGPALFALAAGGAAALLLFIIPHGSLGGTSPGDWAGLALFAASGLAMAAFSGMLRGALGRLESITEAALARQVELERVLVELDRQRERLHDSEERLRLALEAGRMGTWEWDIRTQAVHWSRGLEQIHGLEPGSFAGTFEAYQQDIHPQDRERVLAALRTTVEEGSDHEIEYRLQLAGGAIRWVEGRGKLFRDESGRPLRMAGVCIDITERKRTEESLRFISRASTELGRLVDYESTLQTLVRLAVPTFADWCAVDVAADSSLRRVAVIHADADKTELVRDFSRHYPPLSEARHGAPYVLSTGRPELIGDMPDALLVDATLGDPQQLAIARALSPRSYIGVPLISRGRTLGVLSFATAESGRRYDERDLSLAEELASRAAIAVDNALLYGRLRDADRRKDEFVATLAHELRNPLAPIRNALEILRLTEDPSVRERSRELMERQVQQMVRLVDDLLDISRITQGKVELRRERIELGAAVEAAVETIRPLTEAARHELEVQLPAGPLPLDADLTRLAQVFSNLLANACKYTPPGGRITLGAERDGAEVVVRVADSGIGIPASMLPRIFDMFTQVQRSADRTQGGLGIGLSLVRGLVALHGGSVQARSDGVDKGSEFQVRLPLAPTPAAAQTAHGAAAARAAQAVEAPRKILVVDDNRDAATTLSDLLAMRGHQVHTAYDGHEALRAAEAVRPELILLDIGLPDLSGHEVARALRERHGSGILLVAVTGWGQDEDRRRSREAGFDHHLVKPVDIETLAALLNG